MESLYRRPLPEGLVPLASAEGRRLFRESLEAGTMEAYFPLAEQHHTQADPAFCGLSSLVVALNSLSIDPGRLWKGPWRWFSEELLDCCVSLPEVRAAGLTLSELGCLANCNGADSELHSADERSESELRAAVERVSRNAESVLIASYSRVALGQTGDGHFSPLSGYHAQSDRVLVLDVARFKYPPHWVAIGKLFASMRAIDPVTSRSRGWLELRRAVSPRTLALAFTHDPGGGRRLARFTMHELPALLREERPASARDVVRLALARAEDVISTIALRDPATRRDGSAVEALLSEIRATTLHALVREISRELPELGSVLLFLVDQAVWRLLEPPVAAELARLTDISGLDEPLRADLGVLREKLAQLEHCRERMP